MYLFSNPLTNVSRYSMCEAHNRRGWCWGMLEVWQGAVGGVAGVQWGMWYYKVSGGNATTVCV